MVQDAIDAGIYPQRISQGSSGSYFCLNSTGAKIAVFKPKNEEPYGHLNPKWTKWFHRNIFPCFFGRSGLIPNSGYLSESMASQLDRQLGLGIVPRTDVVELASPTFHYSRHDLRLASHLQRPRPLVPKAGSFQLFLTGFLDADTFLKRHPWSDAISQPNEPLPSPQNVPRIRVSEITPLLVSPATISGSGCFGNAESNLQASQEELPQHCLNSSPVDSALGDSLGQLPHDDLVSRDSASFLGSQGRSISNTEPRRCHQLSNGRILPTSDRREHPSRHRWVWTPHLRRQFRLQLEKLVVLDFLMRNTDRGPENWMIKYCPGCPVPAIAQPTVRNSYSHCQDPQYCLPHFHIGAIDNGLAFPFKHPDEWRSYPYAWLSLPHSLIAPPFSTSIRAYILPRLTSSDWWHQTITSLRDLVRIDPGFNQEMFAKQVAVIKGQAWNLVHTLRDPTAGPLELVDMSPVLVREYDIVDAKQKQLLFLWWWNRQINRAWQPDILHTSNNVLVGSSHVSHVDQGWTEPLSTKSVPPLGKIRRVREQHSVPNLRSVALSSSRNGKRRGSPRRIDIAGFVVQEESPAMRSSLTSSYCSTPPGNVVTNHTVSNDYQTLRPRSASLPRGFTPPNIQTTLSHDFSLPKVASAATNSSPNLNPNANSGESTDQELQSLSDSSFLPDLPPPPVLTRFNSAPLHYNNSPVALPLSNHALAQYNQWAPKTRFVVEKVEPWPMRPCFTFC
ncbi:Phosphatidylinositol 4-kinase [Dispira parvispora]|uniref:Phosphatidylinositol 4-kinase n=1 Tax=Dispira parvispora TaxID=1520584 RepID=A0A9W8E205_9FUNG|nr:Phosphatidylinositol 4-kinase [Dispira parvispora]